MRINPIEFVAKARGGSIETGSTLTPAPHHRGRTISRLRRRAAASGGAVERVFASTQKQTRLFWGAHLPPAGRQDLPRLSNLDLLLHISIVYYVVLFWQNEANRPESLEKTAVSADRLRKSRICPMRRPSAARGYLPGPP